MKIKKIFFNAFDGFELFGLLHEPENEKAKIVVISTHGFGSNSVEHMRDDIIAQTLTQNGISYFCFNNRGAHVIDRLKKYDGKNKKHVFSGVAYENVLDGKFDFLGAILALKRENYEKIVLQGHSLGASKMMLTMQHLINEKSELLNNIYGCIFLSPVDMKSVSFERIDEIIYEAKRLENENQSEEIILHALMDRPMSAKAVLSFCDNIDDISFKTETNGGNFDDFNKISCPIMICFGESDMTKAKPKEILVNAKSKIKNKFLNPVIISKTDHSYHGKEVELSKEILNFVKKLS